jgi:hypothetical protein
VEEQLRKVQDSDVLGVVVRGVKAG